MITLLTLLLAGCPGPKDDTADTSETGDTGDTDETGETGDTTETGDTAATCEDVDGDATAPAEAEACAAAGGTCVGAGSCGGTVDEAASSSCHFDDGPADCCIPPEPAASGDSCAELGGVCAPVGGCYQTNGWFAPDDGGCEAELGPVGVCCLPHDACEDWGTQLCCAESSAYVPNCDRGEVVCTVEGTTLECEAECQF